MSPSPFKSPQPKAVEAAVTRLSADFGRLVRDARLARNWSTQQLADAAGISRARLYEIERGETPTPEASVRLASALGLRLEWSLVDPRRRAQRPRSDVVHSAMGEFEAGLLHKAARPVLLDDPYQHYQFAGRVDVASYDIDARALLQIENRRRFPDFQEMAGSFNGKRNYYGEELARRLGIGAWRSQTHVIAALWSSEVLHALRLRPESFRAICPDGPDPVFAWLNGALPKAKVSSSLVVIDPAARDHARVVEGLDVALLQTTRPRYRGYADAAARLDPGSRA